MNAIVKLATTSADYTIKFKNGDIIADHADFDGRLSDAAIRKQLKAQYPDAKSVFVGATSFEVEKYRMNPADVRELGERINPTDVSEGDESINPADVHELDESITD